MFLITTPSPSVHGFIPAISSTIHAELHRDDPGGVVGVTHHADINLLPTMLGEVWLKF